MLNLFMWVYVFLLACLDMYAWHTVPRVFRSSHWRWYHFLPVVGGLLLRIDYADYLRANRYWS